MDNYSEHTFLTKQETANLLRVSLGTVDNYIKKGYIYTYGFERRVLFSRQEVIDSLIKR